MAPATHAHASEVNDKLSGELRVQLCRAKNSSVAGGTKPIANAGAPRTPAHASHSPFALRAPHAPAPAGIYVEKIVGFIKDKKKQISKSFTMYAVEGGGNGGTVMLKLVRARRTLSVYRRVTLAALRLA